MKTHASSVLDYFGKSFVVGFLLLIEASNVPALAQDGAKAAAAAKEAAVNMQAYLHDLEKSGGRPDYSKPPASEYLKHVFDTDALAGLPPPKAEDLEWLIEWTTDASNTIEAINKFGVKNMSTEALERNLGPVMAGTAFVFRLAVRLTSSSLIAVDALPPDRRTEASKSSVRELNLDLMRRVTAGASLITQTHKIPEHSRVIAAALRDTVTVWAPIATSRERANILTLLEKARTENKGAGIDDDINAVSTAIKNVRE